MRLLLIVLLVAVAAPLLAQEPEKKPDSAELPGKGKVKWDLRGVGDRFTVVRPKYDAENATVSWLLEAKTDLNLKPADLGTGIFDEDRVRLMHVELQVEGGIPEYGPMGQLGGLGGGPAPPTAYKIAKGERIRVLFVLPDEESWAKVRHVVIASKAVPADEK